MNEDLAGAQAAARRRLAPYFGFAVLVLAGAGAGVALDLNGTVAALEALEAITVVLAGIAAAMALVRYGSDGRPGFLVLGTGLVVTAMLDALHMTAGHDVLVGWLVADRASFGAWTWFLPRLYLALLTAWLFWQARRGAERWSLVVACTVGIVALAGPLAVPLPVPTLADMVVRQPLGLLAAAGFGWALWTLLRHGEWRRDGFEHLLVFALIAGLGTDLATVFSATTGDAWSAVAHGLKAVSYGLVLAGLMASSHAAFRQLQLVREEAIRTEDALRANEQAMMERVTELDGVRIELEEQGQQMVEMAAELEKAGLEAEAARDAAEAANQAKSDHLATIAHEIRTPLNGILGMGKMLLETPLDDTQRHYGETIVRSGEAQLSILNDILDLSKITANKLELEDRPFDPRTVAEEVAELMAASKRHDEVDVCVFTDASLPPQVHGDDARLRQILQNLIGNALKFTETGGVAMSLSAVPAGKGRIDLACEVTDTGIGIDAEVQENLFREFSQAEKSTSRRFGGTGLGLAICKKLVELMGGTIGVASGTGRGSCFWFRIQVGVVEAADDGPPALDLGGKRVHVAIKNNVTAKMLKRYLTDAGATVSEGATPEDSTAPVVPRDAIFVDADWQPAGGQSAEAVILVAAERENPPPPPGGFAAVIRKPVCQSSVASGCQAWSRWIADPAERTAAPAAAVSGCEGRILVAEDNEVNLTLVTAMLEKAGYSVDAARDGAEAVERANEHDYDLILMDLHMPRMDGLEATERIRASGGWGAKVPIVALTATVMKDAEARCAAVGMNDFVGKPFKRTALLELVARLIAGADQQQAVAATAT